MSRERVLVAIREGSSSEAARVLERARARGFSRFVSSPATPIALRSGEEGLERRGDRIFGTGLPESGAVVVAIGDPSRLAEVLRTAPDGDVLVLEWTGDRIIPLENAIARRGGHHALWAYARSPEEVPAALGALEHGADRVIVELADPAEVDRLEALVEGPLPSRLEWTHAPVVSIAPAGVGDRVLVDTTSMLRPSEGLLAGSAAAFLFHVASEAVGSRFSRPRPFRVNAGAAHSYVLMADGSTRYLAELEPGDAVLVTEPGTSVRSVRVGRIKIERRPMVMVSADDHGQRRTIFLQEAETVRLSSGNHRVAATELQAGTSVEAVRLPAARHLGTAVAETIEER